MKGLIFFVNFRRNLLYHFGGNPWKQKSQTPAWNVAYWARWNEEHIPQSVFGFPLPATQLRLVEVLLCSL